MEVVVPESLWHRLDADDVLSMLDDRGESSLHYAVRAGNVDAVKNIVALRPGLKLALNQEKEQPHHLCGLRFEEVRPLVEVEVGNQSAPKRSTSGDLVRSAISKSSSQVGESIRRLDLKGLPLPQWGLEEKLAFLRINIIGRNEVISTPNFWQIINPARTAITARFLCYHDYTASGRALSTTPATGAGALLRFKQRFPRRLLRASRT